MSGAIPPFPEYTFMAWCLVKHRDNFTTITTTTTVVVFQGLGFMGCSDSEFNFLNL
jgi:hypothetical protein